MIVFVYQPALTERSPKMKIWNKALSLLLCLLPPASKATNMSK